MISLIVAYSKNRVIGKNGHLPWEGKMPADMRYFRAMTLGKTIIMGRTTFESIGRALPKRQNIVLSRTPFEAPGITVVNNLEDAYALATDEIMVIGGGQVYREALDTADIIYATEIDVEAEGDVTFPALGPEWMETHREDHAADLENAYPYSFVTYTKTK